VTSLESIVLPLAESRALVEHGVVLETVMYWQRSTMHKDHPVSVHVRGDNEILNIEDFFEDICPAPTLGELLDAIRARVHPTFLGIDGPFWEVKWIEPSNAVPLQERGSSKQDSLLAAAALLMEVSR
jgi:hypothetical protein